MVESENFYMPAIKTLWLTALFFLISGVLYGILAGGDAAVAISGSGFAVSACLASFAVYLRPRGMEIADRISMIVECAEWQWTPSDSELQLYWSGEVVRIVRTVLLRPVFGLTEAAFLYILGSVMTRSFSYMGILIFAAMGFLAGFAVGFAGLAFVCLRRKRSFKQRFPVYVSKAGAYWGGTYVPFETGCLKLSHAGCSGGCPILILTLRGEPRFRWFPNPPLVYTLPAPCEDSMMQSLLAALGECYGFINPEGETYGKNEHSMMVGFQ